LTATTHALEVAQIAAQAAADKLTAPFAQQIVGFDVSEHVGITDIFLIISASNERQVGSVVDNIEQQLSAVGERPLSREGVGENRWVLLDYADVVIHVQHEDERQLYGLERLWRDCARVPLAVHEQPAEQADAPASEIAPGSAGRPGSQSAPGMA
jgi:ribosome-associated protein